jgi:DeoR/GlpR family transcriptional regulator of sugar metabolism
MFDIVDVRTIKRDVNVLQSIGVPIDVTDTEVSMIPSGIEELWDGTLVGNRLPQTESAKSRRRLAKRAVDFLGENKDRIDALLLGTGTTVLEVTLQVLLRKRELHISTVCTNSLLVLQAFVSHKPPDIELDLVSGRLDYRTASLRGPEGVKYLSKRGVDAVVTSFTGLTKEGFRASQDYEVSEKRMNLHHPGKRAKWTIVPMAWAKIDSAHEDYLVEDRRKGNKPEYVIITDPPLGLSEVRDRERAATLEFWERKQGVTVLTASREEE